MGRQTPAEKIHTKGSFDLESTYAEIKHEPLGGKLARLYPGIPDDLPIKAMVIYSGGILDYELAEMLISLLNGEDKYKKSRSSALLFYNKL